ncbi:MAG: hypothetical protein L0H26_04755, partial [Microlunatus sp.]|nr:hypothetical protein [Microlunatus sp.]
MAWAAVSRWLMPRLASSSNAAARAVADWWAANMWVVLVCAGSLVMLVVWRVWVRRQSRRRQRQWTALAEGLAPRMGRDWDPAKNLRVRRWRGLRPVRVRVAVTASPKVMDREWRLAVSATARDLIGRIGPIRWPAQPPGLVVWRKPPWVEIRA